MIWELENLDRIPAEEGGDLAPDQWNMTKLKDAGIFAASGRGWRRRKEPMKKFWRWKNKNGDGPGESDENSGEAAVLKRHIAGELV